METGNSGRKQGSEGYNKIAREVVKIIKRFAIDKRRSGMKVAVMLIVIFKTVKRNCGNFIPDISHYFCFWLQKYLAQACFPLYVPMQFFK